MDPNPVDDELGHVMARTTGLLLSDQTADSVLRLLTSTAMHVIPAAYGAGITLMGSDGARQTAAGTDPVVLEADALQYELDEGPCLDAWAQRRAIRVNDLSVESRWPRWAPAAVEFGMRSLLSAAMVVGETSVGALKLYGTEAGSFTEHDQATATLFAAQAAILVNSAQTYDRAGQLSENLQAVLSERDTINRATGLIMCRENVSEDQAFTYLMSRAQGESGGVYRAASQLLGSARRDG